MEGRIVDNKTIRPYEMSVWSLRDAYMATLRAPGIENKGQIEDPELELNTDGTQKLSFKIPMYVRKEGNLVENPRWYDVKHGLLMMGLRKIKLIFNKGTKDEEVFEFLVVNVEEEHGEDGSLYCSVECSGLPFQELGKKGYKISLSNDLYLMEDYEYYDDINKRNEEEHWTDEQYQAALAAAPVNNINYWCDKVFSQCDWKYSIQMDWATYDGYIIRRLTDPTNSGKLSYVGLGVADTAILENFGTRNLSVTDYVRVDHQQTVVVDDSEVNTNLLVEEIVSYSELSAEEQEGINILRERLGLRRNDKVYEEDYVTSWEVGENVLTPTSVEKFKEKYRAVESSASNIYNATQAIAEAFGIYCKYKYHYDDNYHIIGKEVIFYNDFMDELNGVIDLTYEYDLSSVVRSMDSNDICTKLIVAAVDDSDSYSGKRSIMDAAANKSGEDYLLNFDYLYKIGAIEKDQYEEVGIFERKMHVANAAMKELGEAINQLEKDVNEQEANLNLAKNELIQAMDMETQIISQAQSMAGNESGIIHYGLRVTTLSVEDGKGIITFAEKGIIDNENFAIYKRIDNGEGRDKVNTANTQWQQDSYGNITGIYLDLSNSDITPDTYLYIEYDYQPELYYTTMLQSADKLVLNAKQRYDEATLKLNGNDEYKGLYTELEEKQAQYDALLEQKNADILDFESFMGPALREGTWTPENYDNYGAHRAASFNFNTQVEEQGDGCISLLWDDEPFDNENLGYTELSIHQERQYFPCIKLTNELLATIAAKYAAYDEDEKPLLRFKYTDKTPRTYTENNGTFSITLVNGKIFTGSTEEELEEAVIKYGLIEFGYYREEDNIDLSKVSKDKIYRMRAQYGLSLYEDHIFTLGSNMFIGYLMNDETITPVIVLNDIDYIYVGPNATLNNIIQQNPMLCFIDTEVEMNQLFETDSEGVPLLDENNELIRNGEYPDVSVVETLNIIQQFSSSDSAFIFDYDDAGYTFVYPRLYISDFNVKTDTYNLTLNSVYDNEAHPLEAFSNYSVLSREDGYYLTLDDEVLIAGYNFNKTIKVNYVISNAELNIYLDAIEVLKSNSKPQVSYEVDISYLNTEFMRVAYKHLNRIVHINDFELKFENVLGYISSLTLVLDKPWEDTIEIKNYRTKFEDLFSKIVASTQQMQANEMIYNRAAAAFDSNGLIKSSLLQDSINNEGIKLNLMNGGLVIDKINGIRSENSVGAVMFGNNGIFCATDKNGADWNWNTVITPDGINANNIKAGQLDTNLIRIYSGDNLAFQLNRDGLFAYKEDDNGKFNETQYVVHNSQGLFLTQKQGAQVGSRILTKDVDRVEISWDGIKIRNIEGEEVFYADDYGNLTLSGTIVAQSGNIGGWNIIPNALVSKSGTKNVAGMASGLMPNGYNAESNGVYKVFWAGTDAYGNSKFYVNSNGNVFADSLTVNNSLVADHITLNGVPLEDALPEVRGAEDGIHVTSLDGNLFYILPDNSLEEEQLQFAITGHNVKFIDANGELDADSEVEFFISSGFTSAEDEEDVEYLWDICSGIELATVGRSYLTFYINYDIISEIENMPVYFKAEYKDYEDIFKVSKVPIVTRTSLISIDNDIGIMNDTDVATLVCKIFNGGEEIDNNGNTYSYIWKRNGEDWRYDENDQLIEVNEKKLIIDPTIDLQDANNYTFSCTVYLNRLGYEPVKVSYSEFDATIKKWMKFDEETGLWIYGNSGVNGKYATLTDNTGFYVYQKNSATADTEYLARARFSTTCMIENLAIKDLIAKPSAVNGWIWSSQFEDYTTQNIEENLITNLLIDEQYVEPQPFKRYVANFDISDSNRIYNTTNSTLNYTYEIQDIDDINASLDGLSFYIVPVIEGNSVAEEIKKINALSTLTGTVNLSKWNLNNGEHIIIFNLYSNNNNAEGNDYSGETRYEFKSFTIETEFNSETNNNDGD